MTTSSERKPLLLVDNVVVFLDGAQLREHGQDASVTQRCSCTRLLSEAKLIGTNLCCPCGREHRVYY